MISIQNASKTFRLKSGNVEALQDVSLTINDGEIYGVIGYSGAGKSTLVRCINLLETPDSGRLEVEGSGKIDFVNGKPMMNGREMSDAQKSKLRRGIGMIFQHFNLLDRSTVFDNIAYPLKYSGMKRAEIAARVNELLALVDLSDKKDVYPSQLSGGQKQRVAIARALANNPKVLLSDEATSALDPDATEAILSLLKELNQKLGVTIVLITHEMAVIKRICQKVAVMEDGRIVEEGSVYDIFSNPKQQITRKFVSSASSLNKIEGMIESRSPMVMPKRGEQLLRLTFQKECVGDSVVTKVIQKFGVSVNIILANVEILEDRPLGGMVVLLGGPEEAQAQAANYLEKNHISVEVLLNGSVD